MSSEIKHILSINYKETVLRMRTNIPQHVRGGHRAAVRSLCSPLLCVLGTELKSSGLAARSFFTCSVVGRHITLRFINAQVNLRINEAFALNYLT